MEVGPRDGLQNEMTLVDTPTKMAFIENLVHAGIRRIEVTSFVSPRWIPPLADQMEVAKGVQRQQGVAYAGLVPNMQGYENALSCKVDEVGFVIAASESHNRKNINASTEEAFHRYEEIAARAKADGLPFRIYLSCTFGCPFEGEVPLATVVALVARLYALGPYEMSLGDTIGAANPKQTTEVVRALSNVIPLDAIALHMHDTRGCALANIYAALCLGVASFDSSAGGLGGCPYAPGASGNVATEDLVYMLHSMGIATGIDLDKLCQVSLKMEGYLRHGLPSKVLAAYRSKDKGEA